jgi:predicted amidohydrolase YtcJ
VNSRADLLVVGRIASLAGTRGFGWVEAIAIRAGRVMAAGTLTDVEVLAGSATRVWRLPSGLAVVPGITDAHLHVITAALAATQLDLSGVVGRAETLAAVGAAHRQQAAAGDGRGWLLGHGWSLDRMGSWPAAGDLEAAAPGRPVALWAHDHHARWVSKAALSAAGIGPATASPAGGEIRRNDAGLPTGILHENAATLVDRAIPQLSAAELERAVITYATTLAALGVTGAHDPGQLVDDPDSPAGPWLFSDMASRATLPMRVVSSIREGQLERASAWGMRSGRATGRYRDGWLKLFSDGSLGSRSAALLEPYEPDDPAGPPVGGPSGMPLRTGEELAASAAAAQAAGIATQIHAIGDGAVRGALAVLGGLGAPPNGVHHRIEHAQLVHPTDLPRFAALRVAASVQPCHLCSDALAEVAAWGARTANSFPLRSLAATGALIPFGTDAPVESPDPWRNLAAAVARRDAAWSPERGAFHPEEALPIWRALRAACLDPALSAGAQDEGRLAAGFRADMVVVESAGLLADDPSGAALAAIRPLATLIDGEIVFRAPAFAFAD